MKAVALAAGLLLAGTLAVQAAGPGQAALERAAAAAGVEPNALLPDLRRHVKAAEPGRAQPSALLRALQAAPLAVPDTARALRQGFAGDAASPAALLARTARLYLDGAAQLAGTDVDVEMKLNVSADLSVATSASADAPLDAADPLVAAMAQLHSAAGFVPPPETTASRPLREAVARALVAIAHAERSRRVALANVPSSLTLDALIAQATGDGAPRADEPRLEAVLPRIDRAALVAGMRELAAGIEALASFVAHTPELPAVAWRWSTVLGEVIVDTTVRNNQHFLSDPLLVLDVGGNDRYVFTERSPRNRIAVVLDHGGDDRYQAEAAGADASAGVLGYGMVWDTAGDDHYQGGLLAQGAALLGTALHVDGGGNDRYEALGFAQGFALGGIAVLSSRSGDDHFSALTHAQASAGPEAVAVLLDTAGNDRYQLQGSPLQWPSSQLPDRNVSLGQGAARGVRATAGGPAAPGGIGLLIDLAGDDHYSAEVFAQGAGYFEGVGMLIDGRGRDRHEATWYAMGAAAHGAAGVLLDEGADDDRYSASHSTSLGAAHDLALAYFMDEGGNDYYRVGNLGLGAAQDGSVAIFVDKAGDDGYESAGCLVAGVVRSSEDLAQARSGVRGLGVFMDLGGGRDGYSAHCAMPRAGISWTQNTEAGLAAGIDQ